MEISSISNNDKCFMKNRQCKKHWISEGQLKEKEDCTNLKVKLKGALKPVSSPEHVATRTGATAPM